MRIRPANQTHNGSQDQAGERHATERLAAFSDGIFAVAITLLVLDLKVPEMRAGEPARQLIHDLAVQWPVYLSYLLSFVVVGISWIDHHMLFSHIRSVDRMLLTLNLLLLMVVAVMPFPTALLARSLEYHSGEHAAAVIYSTTFLVSGIFWNTMWLYARSRPNLLATGLSAKQIASVTRRWMSWPVVYLIAVALAFVSVPLCLVIYVLMPILFFLPSNTDRF